MDQILTDALLAMGTVQEEHRVPPLPEMKVPVDRTFAAGDTIAVGDASFDVIPVAGHSDCGFSFHERERGILVISDVTPYYMQTHDFWWPNYFTSYQAYLDSMKSLAGLKAEILCLGHNLAVKGTEDIETFFRDAISATEAYHQYIIEEIKGGSSVRELAEKMGTEVFEKAGLMPLDFFQKNCGLLIKQSLGHEGITA